MVPVGFTRPWAAPEAITADLQASRASSASESYRASLHTVSPALDAWSFGVVAYELVTSPTHLRPALRGQLPEVCPIAMHRWRLLTCMKSMSTLAAA